METLPVDISLSRFPYITVYLDSPPRNSQSWFCTRIAENCLKKKNADAWAPPTPRGSGLIGLGQGIDFCKAPQVYPKLTALLLGSEMCLCPNSTHTYLLNGCVGVLGPSFCLPCWASPPPNPCPIPFLENQIRQTAPMRAPPNLLLIGW